ncbi:hypothetical protein LWI29_004008 [Acer saccharum]|uniref:Myosin XI n=1 Tax=Acer saccharum TaxID=4024 RepID=A0AA39W266_ACESA|nr:hypothetical protein LWI29_004008 [Acer saccharum]
MLSHLQGTPVNIIVGSHVWVEDPELAWIDGQVLKITGQNVEVETSDGKKITANLSKLYPKDMEAPAGGVDDMTKLSYLHEPGVLVNLKTRYELNEIYTYTGNILIAINPFQRLPHIYDSHMMQQYKGAPFGELSPHVFAVADVAYRAMINEGKSNSILVSGESGAGKTETTKMLMRYLAFLGGRTATEGRTVEQQVLESNPVLEAFGNAKTVRNNNSSRFGKFVEIQFDKQGRISGAAIRTYLLERSRVCQISNPERNYHCFYLLCAAPQEEVEKYKLGNPKTFHYLNQSTCYELVGVSDAHDYLATRRAMDIVGISAKDQDAIFRVVASILHLGNIEFTKGKEVDSSVPKDDTAKFHLKMASELLMCDSVALEDALCKRVMITPEEVIKRSLDPQSALVSRDGLAKTIYSRLFDCFEQFCINFTNEKLQQHFNQHVFKMEQEEYTKEQIDWSYIEFVDNQDVLDLLEKKPGGIIALLDEAWSSINLINFGQNKDYVVPEHQDLLSASKCSFVAGLFPPLPEASKSSKFSSIGSRFKLQLTQLMETLNSTEPHYIRCVKPNNLLKPAIFENANIMQQLRCGIGKTKVFLRAGQMAELDARRAEVLSNAAKTIQRKIQTHCARKRFIVLREGAICLQSLSRSSLACKLFTCLKREAAAVKIQKHLRKYEARKSYNKLHLSALVLQTGLRAMAARKQFRFRKQTKASIIIQARFRCYKASSYYKKLLIGVIKAQTRWRGKIGRKALRKLKMAARETGALKEAKDKLEKRVEELTWRLQLEKRLRTDLEEAKAQEVAKFQNSLQEMQTKLDEANALLVKERETAKQVIEEAPPVIKETQVLVEDTKKIDSLTEEVESLKTSLESEKQRANESESKYNEAQETGEERRKKLEETEKKVQLLQESLTRLEEKLTNLESENQVLRQQAVSMAPNKFLSGRSRSIIQRVESGHLPGDVKPLTQDNNDVLAYWLSNASTLLLLLQRTLKASGAAGMAPQRRRSSSATLFGRMTQSFRGSPQGVNLSLINGGMNGGVDSLRQVEAKYPALLFKQQLTAYVEKIYGMIRDNLKKEISPLLGLCIQAPRTSRASLVKGSSRSVANTAAQQALIAHWQGIVKSLGNFLNTLKANHVPPFLVRKVFTQIFSFINVQLFNSLLLRRECCSFSNGEYVKAGLAELEHWCYKATDEVIHQKPKKTLDEISHDLCPVLSIQQLYRISTMYWDDKYGTHSVSTDVISNMRVLMTEDSNNAVSNSFLLDDDSSIPFSVDDLSKSMEQIDIADIEPPPLIRENSGFSFLLPRAD